MPQIDRPLPELKTYQGTNPRPADFDAYWDRALRELDAVKPEFRLEPVGILGDCDAELFDLTFTGAGGARVHAKYLRPRGPAKRNPAILEFHGYLSTSGDWSAKLAYVSQGYAVAALDCRGQGQGVSEDASAAKGNTREGHVMRGLDGPPDKMFYRQVFLDTAQLARIVMAQPEVDPDRVASVGHSQGGALALVCAALEPRIRRCAALSPFLCDYQRAWELDLGGAAYADLKAYFRYSDPLHERREAIFTKLGYIDIQHLVPRIRAEVLMGLTLNDTVCPPSTQFAAFNKIASKKEALIYPDFAHETPPGYLDRVFQLMMGMKSPRPSS